MSSLVGLRLVGEGFQDIEIYGNNMKIIHDTVAAVKPWPARLKERLLQQLAQRGVEVDRSGLVASEDRLFDEP